jgi:hypothetical protein
MTRKIRPGDWVFDKDLGVAFRATDTRYGMVSASGQMSNAESCTKLPASPAAMAKSHRLLMRWCREKNVNKLEQVVDQMFAHHARIAGKGKK